MTREEIVRVDIWSDVVCPWCYIGHRRFEKGLAAFEHSGDVEVVYHSFELDPAIEPGQATRVLEMLSAKYGMSVAQAAQAEDRVAATAAADGLGYTVDSSTRSRWPPWPAMRVLTRARRGGCSMTAVTPTRSAPMRIRPGKSVSTACRSS